MLQPPCSVGLKGGRGADGSRPWRRRKAQCISRAGVESGGRVSQSVGDLVGSLVCRSVGWLDLLVGLVGQSVGSLVSWLVGWLVCRSVSSLGPNPLHTLTGRQSARADNTCSATACSSRQTAQPTRQPTYHLANQPASPPQDQPTKQQTDASTQVKPTDRPTSQPTRSLTNQQHRHHNI